MRSGCHGMVDSGGSQFPMFPSNSIQFLVVHHYNFFLIHPVSFLFEMPIIRAPLLGSVYQRLIENYNRFYLKAAKAEENVAKRAKCMAVLLLSNQMQMCYPSTIAAAVVILASLEHHDLSVDNVMHVSLLVYELIIGLSVIRISLP